MAQWILLGASVRAAAFSALRAGHQPVAIDLFADRDLAAVCPATRIERYPGDFLPALAAAPQAPWLYTGGLENYPRLIDRLAAVRPLLGNAGRVLRGVRDPLLLGDVLAGGGFAFPRTAAGAAAGDARMRWLVKPRRSSGGGGVRFATDEELCRPPRGTVLQQYVAGQSASGLFVAAARSATLIGATRQLVGRNFGLAREFAYAGSIGPLALRDEEVSRLAALGDLLARWFCLVGLFGVDFVRGESELWPVEINPRYTASAEVIERATGISTLELHARACREETEIAQPAEGRFAFEEQAITAPRRLCGKMIVYTRRAGIVRPELDELIEQWNQPSEWPLIADLPHLGQRFAAGQPVATVLAEGDSEDEVERLLRERAAEVECLIQ